MRKQIIKPDNPLAIAFILIGFAGSQTLLIMSPWNDLLFQSNHTYNQMLFIFSMLMVFGIGILLKGVDIMNSKSR
jgi:uncharacterized membrane protein